jgi:hypothetical protein
VRCTCAANDYGKNIDLCTWLVLANDIREEGAFIENHLCGVGEVIICVVLPFLYLNLCNRGVSSSSVHMFGESRFEAPDEVRFVCGGSQR